MTQNYKYLYRVLREDENYQRGLTAKEPNANATVEDHVEYGSCMKRSSQFISTTTSLTTAEEFASKSRNWPKVVVKIDVADLQGNGGVEIIDLTNETVLKRHITKRKPLYFARKTKEVLIKGFVHPRFIQFECMLPGPRKNTRKSEIPSWHSRRQSFRSEDRPRQASCQRKNENLSERNNSYNYGFVQVRLDQNSERHVRVVGSDTNDMDWDKRQL